MTFIKKSGTSLILYKILTYFFSFLFDFCSWFRFQGIVLAKTFLMLKLLVIICLPVFLSTFNTCASTLMIRHRSFHIRALSSFTFSSVFSVTESPSSSTSSFSSLSSKISYDVTEIYAFDRFSSPCTSRWNLAVFLLLKNLLLTCFLISTCTIISVFSENTSSHEAVKFYSKWKCLKKFQNTQRKI
jgi:hypothetical protein